MTILVFQSIEPGQQFTWDHSNMECNKPKNRYANVIAYDHSRVILQPTDGSDYINGNYCDGYRKHNAYVATQVSFPGNCQQHEKSRICFVRSITKEKKKKKSVIWQFLFIYNSFC